MFCQTRRLGTKLESCLRQGRVVTMIDLGRCFGLELHFYEDGSKCMADLRKHLSISLPVDGFRRSNHLTWLFVLSKDFALVILVSLHRLADPDTTFSG